MGEWAVTFNFTDEVRAQLEEMISDYNDGQENEEQGVAAPLNTWFEVWHPTLNKAFYVVAQPPQKLPMPEVGQNELLTIDVTFTIVEYKGMDTAHEPQAFVPTP